MNRTNILQEQWDYLIILDACRYDYFERIYSNYLRGQLVKKLSLGSSTVEWRDNSFTKYYDDVVYISSNPRLSSNIRVKGFLGNEHFYKMYDVWKDGWDEKRGTVLPSTVTNAAMGIIKNIKNKRVIIHYLQPHAPYLSLAPDCQGFANPNVSMQKFLKGIKQPCKKPRIRGRLLTIMLRIFQRGGILGDHPEWMLRSLLCLPPKSPMDVVRRKYGRRGLRKAYEANLKLILQEVSTLLKHLSGKIVITSDHGEMLGEKKCYTHIDGSTNPHLLEVPWLVIEKPLDTESMQKDKRAAKSGPPKPLKEKTTEDELSKLSEKLKALGYFD